MKRMLQLSATCTFIIVILNMINPIFASPTPVCFINPTIMDAEGLRKIPKLCIDPTTRLITYKKTGHTEIEEIDATDMTIIPGFIDIQMNGGYGYDFTSDPESILNVAIKIGETGVTSFSPTIISSMPSTYQAVNKTYKKIKNFPEYLGSRILKAHLEGPFITKLGTHSMQWNPMEHNGDITLEVLKKYYGKNFNSYTQMITIAPELPGVPELVEKLKDIHVTTSLGHSAQGTLENGLNSIKAGAKFFTHLYNAMPPVSHRAPGLSQTPLDLYDSKDVFYGMIVDGFHLHPNRIKNAYRLNPNLVLTTDMIAAGPGKKSGQLVSLGQEQILIKEKINFFGHKGFYAVKTKNGELILPDGKNPILAGSVISMIDSVNLLKQTLGSLASWPEVIATASLNPAQVYGLNPEDLLPKVGNKADFLVIDGDLIKNPYQEKIEILSTFVNGNQVYSSSKKLSLKSPQVKVYDREEQLAQDLAQLMLNIIIENNKNQKTTLFGLATGQSPISTYKAFIDLVKKLNDPNLLDQLITVNLDEYVGLPLEQHDHPYYKNSYHFFMEENLFKHLYPYGLKANNTHLPSPTQKDFSSLKKTAISYEQLVNDLIKKSQFLDLQILGIGGNGHIGFNEPGQSFFSETSLVGLDKGTIKDNARFFKNDTASVPKQAITMGIKTIMQAKQIALIAIGEKKSDAIYKALISVPSKNVAASILQGHANTTFFLDQAAAKNIK